MNYFADGTTPRQEAREQSEIEAFIFTDFLSKDISVGLSNSRIVIHKSLLEEIGGLRPSTPRTFHLDDFNLVLKAGTASPCVVVAQPITVAYRTHETNSIRDPGAMVNGILSLIDSEKKGQYPGGYERKWDRYACIGGISQLWIIRSLQAHKPVEALRILLQGAPMLLAAVIRKMRSKTGKKTPVTMIARELKPTLQLHN